MIALTDPAAVGTLAVLGPLVLLLAGMLVARVAERGPVDGCDR